MKCFTPYLEEKGCLWRKYKRFSSLGARRVWGLIQHRYIGARIHELFDLAQVMFSHLSTQLRFMSSDIQEFIQFSSSRTSKPYSAQIHCRSREIPELL